jgi:hypothetical protein
MLVLRRMRLRMLLTNATFRNRCKRLGQRKTPVRRPFPIQKGNRVRKPLSDILVRKSSPTTRSRGNYRDGNGGRRAVEATIVGLEGEAVESEIIE